jgi:DNA adenine methylase
MSNFISPLRYPGGKRNLRDHILKIINLNQPITYLIEPYSGGGAISLELLTNNIVKEIYLNDIDENLFCFWKSALTHTHEFIQKILDTPVTLEQWNIERKILFDLEERKNHSIIDIGFSTFFLNRCNRSGMIRKSTGPIGGREQRGKWKIDARFNKSKLIERFIKINRFKNRIHISCFDALEFISSHEIKRLINNSIFYLDPPYFEQGPMT